MQVPPLRARPEDVLVMAEACLQRHAARTGTPPMRLDPAARRHLEAYSYPLNTQELRLTMQRAIQSKVAEQMEELAAARFAAAAATAASALGGEAPPAAASKAVAFAAASHAASCGCGAAKGAGCGGGAAAAGHCGDGGRCCTSSSGCSDAGSPVAPPEVCSIVSQTLRAEAFWFVTQVPPPQGAAQLVRRTSGCKCTSHPLPLPPRLPPLYATQEKDRHASTAEDVPRVSPVTLPHRFAASLLSQPSSLPATGFGWTCLGCSQA